MARKPRLYISGAFYHLMLRGNAGQRIFFATVSNELKIEITDILSSGKSQKSALARGIAALLTRDTLHLSLVQLAKKLGKNPDRLSATAS